MRLTSPLRSRLVPLAACGLLVVGSAPLPAAEGAPGQAARPVALDPGRALVALPDRDLEVMLPSPSGDGAAGAGPVELAAARLLEDVLLVAGTYPLDDGRRLALWTAPPEGGEARHLRVPRRGGAAIADFPVPLVHDGELAGLAFMAGEGEQALAVRWAPWTGSGWGAPERVSRRGPGSQVALAGTVLTDGSPLLVWAGYDGSDDEIWWSRRGADGWSRPARVAPDDLEPDIVPSVAALPDGGALVAWSGRVDGEYQVHLARFDGTSWSAPRRVGGPGSLYPELVAGEEGLHLLYGTVSPRGWTAVELLPDLSFGRDAALPGPLDSAPVLEPTPDGPALRWPGRPAARR